MSRLHPDQHKEPDVLSGIFEDGMEILIEESEVPVMEIQLSDGRTMPFERYLDRRMAEQRNTCTPVACKAILEIVAGYLSPTEGYSYNRMIELLRERIPGLKDIRGIHPVLFNVAADDRQEELEIRYDCDVAARAVLAGDLGVVNGQD